MAGIVDTTGLADAPLNTNNVVDAGDYLVKLAKWDEGYSKTKGTPFVNFDLIIEDGPVQEMTGKAPTGRHIFYKIYVPSEASEGRTIGLSKIKKVYHVAGIEDYTSATFDDLVGSSMIVSVKVKPYNGEPQNEVAGVKKAN